MVSIVADVPETVQTESVFDAKLTDSPELAEAESVSGVPTVWVPGLVKVIFCASTLTVKLRETGVATA